MVLLRGFTATPNGKRPAGMVAVTVIQPLAARVVPPAEAADATAAVAVAVADGASPVMATVIRIVARWANLMMSCLLAWQ
jgi:hypothetical protein